MTNAAATFPEVIETEQDLDDVLSRPRPVLIEFMRRLQGPLVILGAGGKMGPTLAWLAHRAAAAAGRALDIFAVSRFSDDATRCWLQERGVQTLSIDLLNRQDVQRLPDAAEVVYLVGRKFGTAENAAQTWVINTLVPAYIAERYRHSRLVVLSTGNVYPFVSVSTGGSVETDALTPVGEYANAVVARERVLEFFAHLASTPLTILRLNYAVELRYGVLVDIARRVHAGDSVNLTTGYLNCIWQGDANDMVLRSLGLASFPPQILNLTGPAVLSVRGLALRFGELLGRTVRFEGTESETALLNNPARACAMLGAPATPLDRVLRWTAHWVRSGGRCLDKPTHFEVRDGRY
ncbi:MAG TPA: NAD-dependent epimerase/dehydratase family protein [Gemmataceae bacterium]|nr:NAD-dependent epimerase/dehydratase family protein [Gemmataceae bacterium]